MWTGHTRSQSTRSQLSGKTNHDWSAKVCNRVCYNQLASWCACIDRRWKKKWIKTLSSKAPRQKRLRQTLLCWGNQALYENIDQLHFWIRGLFLVMRHRQFSLPLLIVTNSALFRSRVNNELAEKERKYKETQDQLQLLTSQVGFDHWIAMFLNSRARIEHEDGLFVLLCLCRSKPKERAWHRSWLPPWTSSWSIRKWCR